MKKPFALLTALFCFGFIEDRSFTQDLKKKFEQYQITHRPSSLELYFNQPSYFAGDSVYFATQYTDVQSGLPIQGKDLIHLLLINKHDSVIIHERAIINNGLGSHVFVLPNILAPGSYSLCAYTNWQRNQGENSFFRMTFLVEGEALFKSATGIKYFLRTKSLINGVSNEVTVLTVPSVGVKIVTQDYKEVASAATNEFGLATLKFNPKKEDQYALALDNGEKGIIKEPVVDGITIENSSVSGNNEISVRISPNWVPAEEYFFIVENRTGILQLKPIPVNGTKEMKILPPMGLEGLLIAHVINKSGEIVCTTKVMEGNVKPIGGIKLDKNSYGPREKVDVNVLLQDQNADVLEGRFCVRVIHHDLFAHALDQQPFYLRSNSKEVTTQCLNTDLVKTPYTNWEMVLKGNKPEHKRESTIVISGNAKNGDNEKLLPDSTKIMFFFQNQTLGYETYVKSGRFSLPVLFEIDHHDNIFLSAKDKLHSFNNIFIELHPYTMPTMSYNYGLVHPVLSSAVNPHYKHNSLKQKVNKSYQYYVTANQPIPAVDYGAIIEDELGEPDYTVTMSDYLVLPTMPDIVKELLKSVEYRKFKERERIRVYVTNYNPQKSGDPLYVIDGKLSKDSHDFLTIDPADLIDIKVYRDGNKIFRFGSLSADGVIIVKTRKPTKVKQKNTLLFQGVLPNVALQKQKKISLDLPDLRSSLYWNPNIEIGQDGSADFSFYTADDLGSYVIQIMGTTRTGAPFLLQKQFMVARSSN